MSAILGNPMVTTAALPLLLGVILGLLDRVAALRVAPVAVVLWGAVVLFLHWDTVGLSGFPPISASQKLIYLALLGVLIGLLLYRLLEGATAAVLAVVGVLFAFVWLGWNRLLSGTVDDKLVVAITVAALVALGMAALLARRVPSPAGAAEPFLVPAAVLTMGIAGAIISVLGASIVVGQLLGSLAALAGGYCLIGYLAVLIGRPPESGWTKGVAFLVLYAAASALVQTALLAPKADPVALRLAPLPLLVAALVGLWRNLLPGNTRLSPLVAGFVIAIPAILAVLTAIVWAPEGAALGF